MNPDTWLLTATGKQFDLLNPRPEMVDICDIAHALSNICRFGGHCRQFYSVAQHSVIVAEIVAATEPEHALAALLHDALEAYTGDVIRPLRAARLWPRFTRIENAVQTAIIAAFDLPFGLPPIVSWADNVALATERRDVLAHGHRHSWGRELDNIRPLDARITPLSPEDARAGFLEAFTEYSK